MRLSCGCLGRNHRPLGRIDDRGAVRARRTLYGRRREVDSRKRTPAGYRPPDASHSAALYLPAMARLHPARLVHDLLGEAALRALFALLDISGALVIFSVARRVGLSGAVTTTLACAAVFLMSVMEASTPRALDVICIALCWGAASFYLRTCDFRILAAFPAIGILIANIHGALWPCALMLPLSALVDARLDARSRCQVALAAASRYARAP